MINFRFVNVVWGAAYTETFLKTCLPSSLSAGNLGFIGAHSKSTYRIYTTYDNAETIMKSPACKRLANLMTVEVMRFDGTPTEDTPSANISCKKYNEMSQCHEHFIKTAGNDGTAMVFLSPDLFWADGSLRRLFEIAQSGKRLVMMSALRLAKESFLASLDRLHMKGCAPQPIGKRDLVSLAMNHLHPETRSLIWDSATSNTWPSLLLWETPQEGLMLRAFHLHPLMVRPVRSDVLPAGTIDDDYIARACPDQADEYVVQDSDDMVAFELSSQSARAEFVAPARQNPANVAQWARAHANPKHQKFVQNRIHLHSTEISAAWQETQERSDRAVQEILSLLVPTLDVVTS
jgi:hypothetical protein